MPRAHLPWFKFDCDEWMNNPAIRGLIPAYRAMFLDLLCLMNRSEKRGVLSAEFLNGGDFATAWRRLGGRAASARRALECFARKRIVTYDEHGNMLYEPMITDEQERTKVRSRVEKHRAAASLCNADVTPHVTGDVTPQSKRERESRVDSIPPTPLSKGGDGQSLDTGKPSSKKGRVSWEDAWRAFCVGAALDARGAADYELPTREWFEHKRSKGPLSERGWRALGKQVKAWGPNRLRMAVDYSTSNGYQGLFEARTNGKPVYESSAPRLPHISEVD